MPLSASKKELLTQRVVFNHEILTHRVVARSFKVNTLEAKSLLREFHTASDGRTHATHIVTGYMKQDVVFLPNGAADHAGKPSQANGHEVTSSLESAAPSSQPASRQVVADARDGDTTMSEVDGSPAQGGASMNGESNGTKGTGNEVQCIALIPEDELERRLPEFTRVLSNEIYSVEPSKLPDLVLLTDANLPVLQNPDMAAIDGAVIGTIAHSRSDARKAAGKSAKASKTASTSTTKPDLKRKASEAEVDATSASASKASSSKTTAKAGKDKPAKGTPGSTSKGKSSGTAKTADKGKGKKKDDTEENEAMGQDDDDEYAGMMLDDDDLMAEMDGLDGGKAPSGKNNGPSPVVPDKGKGKSNSSSGKKKTRTVTKKIVTTDAKGRKQTRTVETEEEYSGSSDDDTVTVAASSSRGAAASSGSSKPKKEKEAAGAAAGSSGSTAPSSSTQQKKKPAGKTGDQSSLKSFFGKPKPAAKK